MNENIITIEYQNYISKDLIEEIKLNFNNKESDIQLISIQQKEGKYYNAVGFDIPSITIYIKENILELVLAGTIGGITGNFVYDILKSTIKKIYQYLKNLKLTRITSTTQTEAEKSISLVIERKDYSTKFLITGDLNENNINKAIEQAFEYQKSTEIYNDLKNPDYYNGKINNELEFLYNSDKNIWLPYNFREFREEIIRLKNKFNNEILD